MQSSLRYGVLILLIVSLILPVYSGNSEKNLLEVEQESLIIPAADGDIFQLDNWTLGPCTVSEIYSDTLYMRCGLNILIEDITNPEDPIEVDSISFPSYVMDIALANDLLFVTTHDHGLSVIDISNPFEPLEVAHYSPPEFEHYGQIEVVNNVAYIRGSASIWILDITDIAHISEIYEITELSSSSIEDIEVSGNYLYLIGLNSGLQIMDITVPSNPILINNITQYIRLTSITVEGNYIYLTSEEGNFTILDCSNPSSVFEVGYIDAGYPWTSTISGEFAFIGTRTTGLSVLNISDPSNLVETAIYTSVEWIQDIEVMDNYAYLSSDAQGMHILDITNATSNQGFTIIENATAIIPSFDSAYGIDVHSGIAYVAGQRSGLTILNVSDPNQINRLTIIDLGDSVMDVEVHNEMLFVCCSSQKLMVLNITDPINPFKLSEITVPGDPDRISVSNSTAVIAEGDQWSLVNITNPSTMNVTATVTGFNTMWEISIVDDLVFMSAQDTGFYIYNVSDLYSPVLLDHLTYSGGCMGFAVAGNYTYLAQGGGINVINTSDPSHAIDVGHFDIGNARYCTVSGDLLYMGLYMGFGIADIHNPSNPILIDTYGLKGWRTDVVIDEECYVIDNFLGVFHFGFDFDFDNDQLSNYEEGLYGTDIYDSDSDNDLLLDGEEVKVYMTDPLDPDCDDDLLMDGLEVHTFFTNPWSNDSDSDTLTDYEEVQIYLTNPNSSDSDHDNITDPVEINTYGTDANSNDSDRDNLLDYDEIFVYFTDPLNGDTDNDLMLDGLEILAGLNPLSDDAGFDYDNDGLTNYEEVMTYGTNPYHGDSDNDMMGDAVEVNVYGTDPNSADSDGDGINDGLEAILGLDPMHYQEGDLFTITLQANWLPISLFVCAIVSIPTGSVARRKREKRVKEQLSVINRKLDSMRSVGREGELQYTTREEIDNMYLEMKDMIETTLESVEDMSWIDRDMNITELSSTLEKEYQLAVERVESLIPVRRRGRTGAAPATSDLEAGIQVLRGCEIIGGTFEYKVKVQNESDSVITNVRVSIVAYPEESMNIAGESTREVTRIEIGGFRSLLFRFVPTKDCVEGNIVANVTFLDPLDEIHTIDVNPYTIRSVCDLLKPVEVASTELDIILNGMQTSHEESVVNWNPEVLYIKTKQMLQSKNFHIVSSDELISNENYIGTIRGIAEGKYTEKRIVTIIIISGNKDGSSSNVRIEALGEDITMLPTTIHELSEGVKAWTCIRCGAPLSPESVNLLRANSQISCHYCATTLSITDYTKSSGE